MRENRKETEVEEKKRKVRTKRNNEGTGTEANRVEVGSRSVYCSRAIDIDLQNIQSKRQANENTERSIVAAGAFFLS